MLMIIKVCDTSYGEHQLVNMAPQGRLIVVCIFILYIVHVCYSTPPSRSRASSRGSWGHPPKTRIIISSGPPIPHHFKSSAPYKLSSSSSRSNGRRLNHGPGRGHNGFKASFADCAKQGEWKPIIGPKSHASFEAKPFKNTHHEHHGSSQHNVEHHHEAPHDFQIPRHKKPSHHKDEPIRDVKPTSWAISSSNLEFGNSGSADYNADTGNSDFGGNTGSSNYGSNTGSSDFSGNNGNSDFGSNTGSTSFSSSSGNSDFGGNTGSSSYGGNSEQGASSASFGTPPWWKNNNDEFYKGGSSAEVSSNHADDGPRDDIPLLKHTSKDYAVHEKVEDIPPPKQRPSGGRQILPSLVPTSTPKPPPPPPPPQPSYRPNFFRKRRQKPSVTYHLVPTKH